MTDGMAWDSAPGPDGNPCGIRDVTGSYAQSPRPPCLDPHAPFQGEHHRVPSRSLSRLVQDILQVFSFTDKPISTMSAISEHRLVTC